MCIVFATKGRGMFRGDLNHSQGHELLAVDVDRYSRPSATATQECGGTAHRLVVKNDLSLQMRAYLWIGTTSKPTPGDSAVNTLSAEC